MSYKVTIDVEIIKGPSAFHVTSRNLKDLLVLTSTRQELDKAIPQEIAAWYASRGFDAKKITRIGDASFEVRLRRPEFAKAPRPTAAARLGGFA